VEDTSEASVVFVSSVELGLSSFGKDTANLFTGHSPVFLNPALILAGVKETSHALDNILPN
jgi:hypothetical protein